MAIDATPTNRTVAAAATLSQTIEAAMAVEHQAVKGRAMPAAGAEDRRMLFDAIAIGIVAYLDAHESDLTLVWASGTRPSGAPEKVTIEVTW
jgi:hypothetical protein